MLNHDMPFVGVEWNGSKKGNLLESFSQASSKIRLHISENDKGQWDVIGNGLDHLAMETAPCTLENPSCRGRHFLI